MPSPVTTFAGPIVAHLALLVLPLTSGLAQNLNPVASRAPDDYRLDDMVDTHVHIFGDRAYAYCGHDADPNAKTYIMPDWRIFSSADLVHWRLERVIDPAETYLGAGSKACWATDAAVRDGKYFFYISKGSSSTGVMCGPTPTGPFKDALGKPIIPPGLTRSREQHDPTIYVEDDAAHTPYIVFGASFESTYFIARLNEDMISLAETPRPIGSAGYKSDQNYLFKHNGIYYLTFNNNRYVTSRELYGPYETKVRSAGGNGGHGLYFSWHNQWFRTTNIQWKPPFKFRKTLMTYVHFREDGSLVNDLAFYKEGYGYAMGVGEYDALWPRIEAEWFFAASRDLKHENSSGGFEIRGATEGDSLSFPQVQHLGGIQKVTYAASATQNGCAIELRQGGPNGRTLGVCPIPAGPQPAPVTLALHTAFAAEPQAQDLALVFKTPKGGAITLDWFKFGDLAPAAAAAQ